MPELLPAAPRVIVALAVHSQRTFRWLCLLVFVAALGSLVLFWPILIKEDFEAYLQCDGPQHGRLHLLREVKKQAAHPHGRLLQVPRERSVAKYFVRLIYATGDGDNIFTPKYLHLIREIERRVQRLPSFHRFCLAGDRGRCQPPLSVINYFFATVNGATGAMVPDGQGSKLLPIQSILASLGTSNSYFVDRYFGVSQSQLQAALEGNITRSVLRFGLPLRGFSNLQDHQQFELFSQFVRDELRPTLVEATSEELKVFFYGDAITQVEVEATVWHDAAYATGSLAFIFLYLVFYLRSLWLTIMALFCIALCFPISYACYCLVYGHGKMIAINFLSLFVVLGVGADDVFVLHDVWFLTKGHGTGEMALARRMWSMYCKAGMAIFATSATTAASFFANLASSIGPLRQFGFFMGTCITVNWIIVATLYPLVLVNHERSQGPLEVALEEQLVDGSPTDAEEKTSPGRAEKHGATCKGRREAAGVIALLGVGASLFALTTAVHQLRPSNGLPQFFPKDSNLGGLQELQLRFGNETSVNMQEMAMCNGQVQTSCRPRDLPSLPLPRPSVKASRPARPSRPGRPSGRPQPPPPQQPRPVTSAPTQGPPRRPLELGEDYNVRLRVQGPADPQELEVLREKILTALKLKPEDLEFEVQAVPDGSGRRLEELEVTLHFQHLSTQQEHQIQDFLKQNQELLQAFGAKDVITTVPPSRATEPMPEPMPEPTPQAKTSSLTVARTTTPPTRPTTRRPTTVEHPATTRAPTTPRSPSASTLTTTFPVLHLQKRGMAKDRQAQVFVVFGFRQVPGSYNYVLDDSFDLSAREAQLAVVEFCKLLRLEKALKVVPGVGNCWPEKMKMYMNMRHLPWPTYNFFPALQRFVRESEKWVGEHVGMDQGAVQWCQMDFNVEVDIWSSGRQVQPYMDLWDETVSRVLRAASEKYPGSAAYLGSPVPVSDLFQRAEAENRVVNSALSSWVVSVGCALVALAFFTRSCWLSGLACFAMLSTAACSLFFITSVFHWSFGLMEAVSLIIFCGFSVDYPLHVVQAYVQERQKGAHIRHALREVGSAVASGCVTTCGAALFLLFCQIRIFTRFGQVLVVNMLCSLIFALLWIPAVLELCRPNVTPVSKDEEGFAMGLLGESAGSAGRRSTPGPSARDDRLMLEMEESEAGGFSALQG